MNKVKVRCSVCGKNFKTPSAKKTVCPACDADLKRAKHQQAAAPAATPTVSASPVDVRAALRAAQENQGSFGAYRAPEPPVLPEAAPPKVSGAPGATAERAGTGHAARAAHPHRAAASAGRPRATRPPAKPKVPREPKPRQRMKPFEPSPEQVAAIRERYLALATPEFDGIRHRIANELGVPLRAVKDVVKSVRAETATPSWWERTGTLLAPEQVEQIKALYVPLLPNPAVGVHKEIAASLKLSHSSVYQAIGTIRAELALPRFSNREALEPASAVGASAPATAE